jgi:hypothetical protein
MAGRWIAATSACFVVVLCGCGGKSAPPKAFVIGRDSAAGKKAAAEASGKPGRLGTLSVHVRASPNQRVTGSWSIGCRNGIMMVRDADTFSGRTPLTVPIRALGSAPFPDCTVVGDAALVKAGRVTVELLGR